MKNIEKVYLKVKIMNKRKTIKINAPAGRLLWEAMRRILCLGEKKSLDDYFIGLGFPSEYKAGVQSGLFVPSYGTSKPRIMAWYKLTSLGQQIIKQMIRKKRVPKNCHDVHSYICGDVTIYVPEVQKK